MIPFRMSELRYSPEIKKTYGILRPSGGGCREESIRMVTAPPDAVISFEKCGNHAFFIFL